MDTIIVNDITFIGYVLLGVFCWSIAIVLGRRLYDNGLSVGEKYTLLICIGFGIRMLAVIGMRFLYLSGSYYHMTALKSFWWVLSPFAPAFFCGVIFFHLIFKDGITFLNGRLNGEKNNRGS